MKPTSATLRYVENAVKGYCDIHKFKVVVRHDTDYEGTVIYSRFRTNDNPRYDVSIKWPNVTDVSATIDSVCDTISRNVAKNRYSNIDISHEMNLLSYCSAQINKKPDPTPEITNVIFSPPATIIYWSDKTKTVVKTQNGEPFDPEKGLAMAIVKKMNGNTGKYCDIFKKWVPEEKSLKEMSKDLEWPEMKIDYGENETGGEPNGKL